MLNQFCFHVYALKSHCFYVKMTMLFRDLLLITCEFRVHRAGSQLKTEHVLTRQRCTRALGAAVRYRVGAWGALQGHDHRTTQEFAESLQIIAISKCYLEMQ